jgi:MFS family permease
VTKLPVGSANGALALLTAIVALNLLDRQILSILAEPIKKELALSDLQLGLLTGLAFSGVYTTFGVLFGRLADRSNRAKLICGAAAVWSVMTGACGLVTTFPALLVARMGVAIGEAGSMPATVSLLADHFPPHRRAFALAVTQSGGVAGTACALLLGGLLAQAYGWRVPLIVVAVLGLLLATVCWWALAEPRVHQAQRAGSRETVVPFGKALRLLAANPAYRWLMVGGAAGGFGMYSLLSWTPSYFQRVFGWSIAEAGTALSLAVAAAGVLGALLNGWLSDRLLARDVAAHSWVPALGMLSAVPFTLIFLLSPSAGLALAGAMAVQLFSNGWQPGTFATIQGLVDSRMRALASAVGALTINIVGMGLGPLIIGTLSDVFHARYANESLRYALLPPAGAYLIAGGAYMAAARTIRRQAARMPAIAPDSRHAA